MTKKIILLLILIWALVGNAYSAQRTIAPGKWIPTGAISYDYCDQWTLAYLQSIANFDLIDGAQLGVKCPATGGLTDVDSFHKYHPSAKVVHYISGINNLDTSKATSLTLGTASGHDTTWLKTNHGIATGDPWFEKGNRFNDYLELGTTDNNPNIYSMNVGASGWWNFIATEAFTWSGLNPYTNDPVTAVGSDGVFLDNSDISRTRYNSYLSYQWGHPSDGAFQDYESHYYSGSPGTFNSSKYRTDYLNGISAIVGALPAGKILVPNIDPISTVGEIAATWGSVDALTNPPYAAMHENAHRFSQWGWSGNGFLSNLTTLATLQRTRAYLSYQMNFPVSSSQLSAMSGTDNNTGVSGWQGLWFYIANFMLGLDDRRVSGFLGVAVATNSFNAYRFPIWFDEFDPTKLHLGAAIGSYSTSGNGVYIREFDDGWVVANTGTLTVNNVAVPSGRGRVIDHNNFLNANAATLVTTFNIAPSTGLIILKEGKSITNSDNPNDPVSGNPPVVAITGPTSNPTFTTSTAALTLSGTSTQSGGSLTWSCDRCGSGTATVAANWSISGITLKAGINIITVTANDSNGTAIDTITVTYSPTFPGNSAVLLLGFENGSGTSATDSSGNGNTGTLTNGVTWTTNGRFGKAVSLNGINNYVNVIDANSLHLTQSWTISAYVLPVASFTTFKAIVHKNATPTDPLASGYELYGSISAFGGCTSGGVGGLTNTNGASGPRYSACTNTPLQTNVWTHLAATYDGAALKLYRDGVLISTTAATGYIEPSTGSLQIGASEFGEQFQGLIDEVRVYNFALPLTAASNTVAGAPCTQTNFNDNNTVATASIVGNMNCPIINLTPPTQFKVSSGATQMKFSASATGLKIGANP